MLRPGQFIPVQAREQRLETAYQVSVPLLAKQFDRRAVLDGADVRIAAAKGLIAAGVESPDDVNAIHRRSANAVCSVGVRMRH